MNPDALNAAARVLEHAEFPEDVFGVDPHAIGTAFNQIVQAVHPDKFARTAHEAKARKAFERLVALRGQAAARVAAGTYGKRVPAPAPVKSGPRVIQVQRKRYTVGEQLFRGDFCDLYQCTADGAEAVLKLPSHARDNDLLENEAKALKALFPPGAKPRRPRWELYFPEVLDAFALRGKTSTRRALVLRRIDPVFVSLADVLRGFPHGIDFRDLAWMFKRLLAALGYSHSRGYVHAGVVPEHFLVHPVTHGGKLIDWAYAVPIGQKARALSVPRREFYAPEVLDKAKLTPATDIYMAARCAAVLLSGHPALPIPRTVPAKVEAFLTGCMLRNPARRPPDAWALHDEFDDLLRRLVGKPRYRPFDMTGN